MGEQMVSDNVCSIIVKNDFCIGCGVCAGICPSQTLKMMLSPFGEFNPVDVHGKCLANCHLCLTSCPFGNRDENEDTIASALFAQQAGIKHTRETGYYLSSYVGFSNVDDHRANGSSGGLATWLLEKLLTEQRVDHVICVRPAENEDTFFKFDIFTASLDVRNASRSSYYPNQLSEVIQYVLNHSGRYAVTGLPCYLKALRLASAKIPKLRTRIIYYVGLACGQLPSTRFVDYMAAKLGIEASVVCRVQFRVKDYKRPANDYGLMVEYQRMGAKDQKTIYRSEGMGRIWSYGYFKHNACSYCDDVFAEVADVVLMDAWLQGYAEKSEGFSIALIRHSEIEKLFIEGAAASELSLQEIPIEAVMVSQRGVLTRKRTDLADRLNLAKGRAYVPQKRVAPSKRVPLLTRLGFWLADIMRAQVRRHFDPGDAVRSFRVTERKIFPVCLLYRIVVAVNKRLFSR